ncbi:MAG: hypothetical protein V1882_05790 [Candidatus Omnitrophota bacterium]
MAKFVKVCLWVGLVVASAGCTLNRSFIEVPVPSESLIKPNGKQVYIRSIIDNRQFQDQPSTPDIPSLGFDELKNATPALKSRAIGRKRNCFGKALGDIMLDEGQNVEMIVRAATRNALNSLGYDVTDKREETKPDAITMDIAIDKFWSYFAPGFWAISLKSEITTTNTISVPGKDNPVVIMATAEENFQVASDANWKKVLRLAVDDFTAEAKTKLQGLELSHDVSTDNKTGN